MRNSRDERRDETIAITRLLTIVPRLVSSRLVFFRRPMSQGLCKNYALRLSQIVNMVRKWWEESEDDDENECKCNSLLEFSLTINSSRLPGPRKMREFRQFYKGTFDPINRMAEEKKVSRTAARATGGAPRETRDETRRDETTHPQFSIAILTRNSHSHFSQRALSLSFSGTKMARS